MSRAIDLNKRIVLRFATDLLLPINSIVRNLKSATFSHQLGVAGTDFYAFLASLEFFTAKQLGSPVFCDVTLRLWVNSSRRFDGMFCFLKVGNHISREAASRT
jgi:hypothetical protein